MLSSRSLRATAISAAAFTLAACGSDKAAGPTTANNAQIVSEMQTAMGQMDSTTAFEQGLALQLAIVGLSTGSPVNPGNVSIDGRSYNFSTMSLTIEERDSASSVTGRTTVVVGWRHTNGDSVFIAGYAPAEGGVLLDRRAPSTILERSGRSVLDLAGLSRMLQSGNFTVSKAVSPGPDGPVLLALVVGGDVWGAESENGIVSGSISSSGVDGDCDTQGMNDVELHLDGATCELQRSNISMQANTWDPYSDAEVPPAGPSVTIASQSVTGVKFVFVDTTTVQ
ncbi:MAG TPA: hypothetical protein VIR34_16170 [Gemmatimonadaceae bacterium]|jgi:hypothetical protein